LIAKLRGLPPRDGWVHAVLATHLPMNGPREFYQPATLDGDGMLTPLEWKGSADVFTLARADALLVRAANELPRIAGELVRAIPIPR
jgi:molybdopterin molybdotransferase